MSNIVIDVNNVSKVYKMYEKPIDRLKESINPFRKTLHKDFYALRDMTFQIKKGETVGIIGKNGAGKSTLLKMITGVLNPTTGNIQVNGNVSALLELGTGFNPEVSGLENIYFNGMLRGISRKEMDKKVDDILSFADIGDHIYQPVKSYSSGMFVRLAFSVAVSISPEILIIDEALSVGDVRFRQKATRKMKELMSEAKAILFVSHDMESVKNLCDDVIWLKDGTVFERGKPKDIIQRYYNYMIHDILPSVPGKNTVLSETSEVTDCQNQDDLYSGIEWTEVSDAEIVGRNGVTVNKVAFYTEGFGKKVDVLDGSEEKLVFLVDLNINEEIDEPLIGFGIFNQYGVSVVHFNSSNIENVQLTSLEQGRSLIISCSFLMPKLQNGTYTISFGMNNGTLDNNEVIQHVRECYLFKISRTRIESRQHGLVVVNDACISMNSII